jgi:hypothetical protein
MSYTDKTKEFAKNLFDKIGTPKAVDEAQRVINLAVEVLEEEVAAGIVAAKKIEERMIDVDEVRNEEPDALMSKFRRDAHDVVDIFMDSVSTLYKKAGSVAKDKVTTEDNPVKTSKDGHVPIIRYEQPALAGQTAELPVSFTNDEAENKVIALVKQELTDASGATINARNVKTQPAEIELASGDKKIIIVQISVPKTTKPGLYTALFRCKNDPSIRLVIELEIA